MPPRPNDDEAYTPKGDLWLGWMFERGCKMQERQHVMEILGVRE